MSNYDLAELRRIIEAANRDLPSSDPDGCPHTAECNHVARAYASGYCAGGKHMSRYLQRHRQTAQEWGRITCESPREPFDWRAPLALGLAVLTVLAPWLFVLILGRVR